MVDCELPFASEGGGSHANTPHLQNRSEHVLAHALVEKKATDSADMPTQSGFVVSSAMGQLPSANVASALSSITHCSRDLVRIEDSL
jgi:hypothetical protein